MATKRVMSACTIIFNQEGDLLLINKRKYDQWECPGGKVDGSELMVAAACRELFEETGILVPNLIYLGYYDRNPKWLCNVFTGYYDSRAGQPKVMEPDKHSDIAWATDPEDFELTAVSGDLLINLGFYRAARKAVSNELAYEGIVARG